MVRVFRSFRRVAVFAAAILFTLLGLGNVKEARVHFARALQIDPKNELARENLEELDRENQKRPQ